MPSVLVLQGVQLCALGLLALSCRAQVAKNLATFTVKENFGVSHPRQIIDFDFSQKTDPTNAYMLGPDGAEVAYQVLSNGNIAVETDLPANGAKSWKLMAGRAAKRPPTGLQLAETSVYYEITNGLTGVRVSKAVTDFANTPAPVQGVLYRDGTWTATGPNRLSPMPGSAPPKDAVLGMTVKFLERGPLKVKLEVSYRLKRQDKIDGTFKPNKEPVSPEVAPPVTTAPGEGYYTSTIELQASQPSILFEEDTDSNVYYALNMYDGLRPTQGRYRGHHAADLESGRDPKGRVYDLMTTRNEGTPQPDALVDLKYDSLRKYPRGGFGLSKWDPWAVSTGWYWQYYDDKGAADSNLMGIFAGPASRMIGTGSMSFLTSPAGPLIDDPKDIYLGELPWYQLYPGRKVQGKNLNPPPSLDSPAASVIMGCARRDAGGGIWPRSRFAWGLFVGTKKDLLPPYDIQPINLQMNLHGGINLNKISRFATNFPDPPQGYGALFMDRKIFDAIIEKARNDKAFYTRITSDATLRPIVEMRLDPTGKKIEDAVKAITDHGRTMADALVNGGGIYQFEIHYFHGALRMSAFGNNIDQVLADPRTTAADKARVKAAAALYCGVSWDDDFAPLYAEAGANLGPHNMPMMMRGNRTFYAMLLASDPSMSRRIKQVEQETLDATREIINESGAEVGSSHYIAASFIPTLNSLLQLRMIGKDHFGREPRLARFAEFYMNFLGPPEVRFGGKRKKVAIGDASPESSSIYGRLATGFRDADPALSARLMGAWWQGGWHDGFMGSSILQIDETAPSTDPKLGSATFPGYYSVLRSGWGTLEESALWMVNGDYYNDHRHHDHGSVALYALCAPISLDWGSMYYPRVAGGYNHNMILPVAHIEKNGGASSWNADSPTLESGGDTAGQFYWSQSKETGFKNFRLSAQSVGSFTAKDGTAWKREASLIHPNSKYPVILLRDRFDGKSKDTPKVFTLTMMAQGDVETPNGKVTPVERTFGAVGNSPEKKELPSSGPVFKMPATLNRFGFSGQWGVDWDLYTFSDTPQEAFIGNWGNRWAHMPTGPDFQNAMKRPYEERQHILRIKGEGSFSTLILPYKQGTKRPGLQVSQKDGVIAVVAGDEKTLIGSSFYAYRDGTRQVLTTFDDQAAESDGMRVQGGPMEIVLEGNSAELTAHGEAGVRRIKLPGNWVAKTPNQLTSTGGEWSLSYAGGAPLRVRLEKKQ